jgi:GAF domain-containing protein
VIDFGIPPNEMPMFRGDDLVGVFILYKLKVQPFTEKQIELVITFADQAVIATESARLLNELRQRTTLASAPTTSARRWSSGLPPPRISCLRR